MIIRTSLGRGIARVLVFSLLLQGWPVAAPPARIFLPSIGVEAAAFTLFGPRDYMRKNGAPVGETAAFPGDPAGSFVLRIENRGSAGHYAAVTSAVITLNGVIVVAPHEFNPGVNVIEKSVPLAAANTLVVELRGTPGSGFTLLINGDDSSNRPPTARAGGDQTVGLGDLVQLNGSGSSDPDGDALTYAWSVAQRPAGSNAMLSNPSAVQPTFTVDVPGTYRVALVVNDGSVNSTPDEVLVTTTNSAPSAAAGPDQTVAVGDAVTLNGSGSSDPDGDALTYSWTLVSLPPGSAAALSNPSAVHPTFVADRFGTYVARLIVNDGQANSAPDTVSITTSNSAPVAEAGPNQTAHVGEVVTLDGSGSHDVDGNALTFQWALISVPAGSMASLSNPSQVAPTFTVDEPGEYVAQLIVNDGIVDSAPDAVSINTVNSAPEADAGPDQSVFVDTVVTLDGSGSLDVDGDALSFSWSLLSVPAGSAAVLSDPSAVGPQFTVDGPGEYVAQLTVNDGTAADTDTVVISTENSAPVADAGTGQTVLVGDLVTLNGSGSSDADGDALTFEWSFLSRPAGSSASLSDPGAVQPTFTVDRFGAYLIQLIVNDGTADSEAVTVTISTENSPPKARAGADQSVLVGATVTLDGSGSSDVDGNALTFQWSLISVPAGSTASLTNPSAVTPAFAVDLPGTYVAQLIVNDGTVNSEPDTVSIRTANSPPVADAGEAQTVFVGTEVTLDGTESRDVDGDTLTYFWAFTSRPAGSTATLSDAASVSPVFTVDRPGEYVVQLIVNDGTVNSTEPATVVISTTNSQPVAEAAGPDQPVTVGDVVTLDGTGSHDSDFDPLTYEWSLTVRPAGSTAVLSDPTAAMPTFGVDRAGTYIAQLIVNDGTVDSDPVTVLITTANRAPIADAGAGQAALVGDTVTLDGSGSSDPDGDALTYLWSFDARPPGSAAAIVDPTAQNAVFVPDRGGDYVLRLVVNDGSLDSAPAMVTVSAVAGEPVLESIAVTPGNVTKADGESQQYTATGTWNDGHTEDITASVFWESTSPAVAFMNATGIAEALDAGVATIRATQDGVTGSTLLTVTGAALSSIVVTPANPIALVGDTVAFAATGVFSDGTSQNLAGQVTWTSDSGAAVINPSTGVALAAAEGGATIRATKGGVSGTTLLTVQPKVIDGTLPNVNITAPANNAVLTESANIVGTATDTNFSKYVLDYAPAGSTAFTPIVTGTTAVNNGLLGVLDPSLLVNDIYEVRLRVFDRGGNIVSTTRTYQVSRDVKVGNFTLSFQDLNVPMAGLPIAVNRVYDSRDKRVGDFGVGWRLDIQTLRLTANRVLGTLWQQTRSGGLFPTYCIAELGDQHKVSITLADGTVEEFSLVTSPQCQQIIPISFAGVQFVARPGTRGSLVPLDQVGVLYSGGVPGPGDLLDDGTLDHYNPQRFQYTTYEGMVFVINKATGVESARDRNGNTLTFTASGIVHSAGASVTFVRDAQGRITRMTDPSGKITNYTYDANGDLSAVADPGGNTTRFFYNLSHGVIEVRDPRGLRPLKNEYDANGRLVAHIDAQGRRVEYSHVVGARQEVVQDRNGGQTVYEYDQNGNVIRVTDPLGKVFAYTYDARGNKLTETDPLGKTTTWTYDANNNITSERDPLGNTTGRTFNADGQALTQTDALGRQQVNTYSPSGNLLTAKDPSGATTTLTYDARGNLLTATNALGQVTTSTYDANGRVTSRRDAAGNTISATYDAAGRKLTETDARGGVWRFTYDAAGRESAAENPLGQISRSEYDAIGNRTATINPLGARTETTYDAANRPLSTRFPDGTSTVNAYDAEGNLVSTVDQLGRKTEHVYNSSKQRIETKYPGGAVERMTYDAAGRALTATDPLGHVVQTEYDAAGRRIGTTDPLGNETTYLHNAVGNETSRTDANAHTTSFAYDQNDRLTVTTAPLGQTTTLVYDTIGRQSSEVDAAGHTAQFTYDANGNLTSVTDAAGGLTRFEYDAADNRTAIIDARGNQTSFVYDLLDRLTSKALPNGGVESYTYDAAGRVSSKTDPLGRATNYTYDMVDRLITRQYPDGTQVRFTYTPTGRRATAQDARGVTSYTYDVRDRLTSVVQPDGQQIAYTYDAAGNPISISSLAGTISYIYDQGGRLQQVTDPAGRAITYTYDAAGNRTGLEYPNGTSTSYIYDANNRLTRLQHEGPLAALLAEYVYTLGPAGNRTRIDESTGRIKQYGYDQLYRLVEERVSDLTGNPLYENDFSYDAVGNRLQKLFALGANPPVPTAYTYNAADQLVTEDGISYAYDLNGNLTTKTDGAAVTSYHYDFDNRLVRLIEPSAAETRYRYDADGNRVEKQDGAGTLRYLVDANRRHAQVVAEYSPAGALVASYVYADDLISLTRGAQTAFYHFDGNGSTRLLTDLTGAVTDAYDYDAFGTLILRNGTTDNPFLFTGQQFDANSGFYYLRARYYNPSNGRFLSLDPVAGVAADPPTLHRYVYSLNDPVNRNDPSGEFSLGSLSISISIGSIIRGIASLSVNVIIDYVLAKLTGAEFNIWLSVGENLAFGAIGKGLTLGVNAVRRSPNTMRLLRQAAARGQDMHAKWFEIMKKARLDAGGTVGFCHGCFTTNQAIRDAAGNVVQVANRKGVMKTQIPDFVDYGTHTIVDYKPVPQAIYDGGYEAIAEYCEKRWGTQMRRYIQAYQEARGVDKVHFFWDVYVR